MADYASDIVFRDGTCYCFEDETELQLWRAAFPAEYENRAFSVNDLHAGSSLPGERASVQAKRLAIFQPLLSPEQLPRAEALLGTLELLRGALILTHEDADFCFSLLSTTPKNVELKTLLHLYLDSPLSADRAQEIWELIENLKNGEVSFSLGRRVVFVRALDSGYLFNELAKIFSYAKGVDEAVLTDPWEISVHSSPEISRKPLLLVGDPGDCLRRLGEHALRLIDRGVKPEEIHIPFHGAKAQESWLRYFFDHHHVASRMLAPPKESNGESPTSVVAKLVGALRKDNRLELKDRLKLASLLLRDEVGKMGAMDWNAYLDKLHSLGSHRKRSFLFRDSLFGIGRSLGDCRVQVAQCRGAFFAVHFFSQGG